MHMRAGTGLQAHPHARRLPHCTQLLVMYCSIPGQDTTLITVQTFWDIIALYQIS